MIIQPSTGGKAPTLDDDVYNVTCIEVKSIHLDEPDQFGRQDKLEFKILLDDVVDEEGEPIYLEPRCNQAWSERATLFKWAQAFGIDCNPAEPVDTEAFHGMSARADIRTESAGKWPRVHDFLPERKARNRNTPPAQEPDYDAFWKRIRAIGLENTHVAKKVGGDLKKLTNYSQSELDKLAVELGA